MARRSSVRYWRSRNGYCCWFGCKQEVVAVGPDDFPSGPTYQAALDRFKEMTALSAADTAKDRNTARVVCELYLRWISSRRKAGTLKIRKLYCVPFADALGDMPIQDLTQHAVYRWLDGMREWRKHPGTGLPTRWTNGSVRAACSTLQAAFNWAVRAGLITKNPLAGMEQPSPRSRGREALTGKTPEERQANHRRILEAATVAFRPFVICLEATGCRPGELSSATAADFDAELGALVYHTEDTRLEHEFSHKTAGKGKDRIIFLSGEALEVVKGLVKKHPTGPLFRTGVRKDRGRGEYGGWNDKEISKRFRVIRRTLGIPRLTAYSYRHTFGTA
jgi:integrase